MLTDDSTNPRMMPTRENMVRQDVSDPPTDLILFRSTECNGWLGTQLPMTPYSFTVSIFCRVWEPILTEGVDSGHGGQTKDLDGDEADGFDEGTVSASETYSSQPDTPLQSCLVIYPVSLVVASTACYF